MYTKILNTLHGKDNGLAEKTTIEKKKALHGKKFSILLYKNLEEGVSICMAERKHEPQE